MELNYNTKTLKGTLIELWILLHQCLNGAEKQLRRAKGNQTMSESTENGAESFQSSVLEMKGISLLGRIRFSGQI